MKLSSGILQNIGMKKPPVGAGTFCPLYILLFSIPPCRKCLPVSGARDSPTVTGKFHTDKKENKTFLIYKEIQMGSGAKSYMTNGLLIYGEKFTHFLKY
jgi:hypothetical protein